MPQATVLSRDIRVRLNSFNWDAASTSILDNGFAILPGVLSAEECGAIAALYGEDALFRTLPRGRTKYKYLSYPLPPMIERLRTNLYQHLVPPARRWAAATHTALTFPDEQKEFLETCRIAGQSLATPVLLRYTEGDFNCLHQDLFGEVFFPFQVVFLLSKPGADFTGGEFLLAEHRPRSQVSVRVIPMSLGDAVLFASHYRAVPSGRGNSRAAIRHGVSTITQGQRVTMGILFHDAA